MGTSSIAIDSKNLYRINDFALIKINPTILTDTFWQYNNQYFQTNDLNLTVWSKGEFAKRINKVYSNPSLYDNSTGLPMQLVYSNIEVLIAQGTRFDTCFGFLVVIQNISGTKTYTSRLFTMQDIRFNDNIQLIDGTFWVSKVDIKIPKIGEQLAVSIMKVNYSDIEFTTNIGYIYTYPTSFEPLVYEKPTPDFIVNYVEQLPSNFIKLGVKTTENKTLEQSILDYFEQDMANIEVNHVIKYGTEEVGFSSIRVSNQDNIYNPITIGLDYSKFLGQKISQIMLYLSTEIEVDSKLMKREISSIINLFDIINPMLMNQLTVPETVFPVEVTVENVIQNTVIDTKTEVQIVPIHQPIFAELITDSFKIENKDIAFQQLTKATYLRINKTKNCEEQIILSKATSEGKIYFDISQLIPIDEETTYDLISVENSKIIGKGKVLIN